MGRHQGERHEKIPRRDDISLMPMNVILGALLKRFVRQWGRPATLAASEFSHVSSRRKRITAEKRGLSLEGDGRRATKTLVDESRIRLPYKQKTKKKKNTLGFERRI